MTKIIIQGIHGRMGQVLCDLIAQRTDCRVVAGIDRDESSGAIPVFTSLEAMDVSADVLIDFSIPLATASAVKHCKANKLPMVICTTGLDDETLAQIEAAGAEIAIFKSGNMSLGINLLADLCRRANAVLGTDYDIEIVEKHHHNKLDAPSGTALLLADAINEQADEQYRYVYERESVRARREKNEIGISAIRGGSIVGEHDVLFCGPDEVITLQHTAYSRNVFANGAINAAVFLAGKAPGFYSMSDLLAQV